MSASDNDRAGELLLQEVDEELRRERYLKLWRRYGNLIIVGVIALVAAVAGYQGWRSWQTHVRQQDAARFAAAETLIADGKTDQALAALDKLFAEGRTGYAMAAMMATAEIKARAGDYPAAMAAYERVASSSGAAAVYRDLALLKESLLAIDSGDAGPFETRLGSLTVAGNPWRHSALEALAMIALKKGDTTRAEQLYRQLADDLQAPRGVRARAAEMLATLPPPAPSPSPADKVKG